MKKFVARIRLFLLGLKIVWGGGLAMPDVWRQKEKLEEVLKSDSPK